ncbi:MAG: proton-conducting transporter transmembrane domain-containing protein [Anaerolineae bacterium]
MITLWLILLPIVGTIIITGLRRWPIIIVPVTAAILLAMSLMAVNISQPEYTFLLGRLIVLSPIVAMLLAFCYLLTSAIILASYRLTRFSTDYIAALAFTALITIAVTIEDNTLAAMFFSAASIVLILILASEIKNNSTLNVLSVLVLLGPLLLITIWALESRAVDPNDLSLIRVGATSLILVIALGLGILPVSLWMLPVFRNGKPLAVLFVYILQLVLVVRLSSIVTLNLWPDAQTSFASLIVTAGLVTAIGSGILAAFQNSVGAIFAFTIIADMGIVLISSGLGINSTLQLGLLHLLSRGLGIAGLAVGLGVVRAVYKNDTLDMLKGAWSTNRTAVIGILLCALSLVGFPFTAGFITKYGILSAMGSYRLGWTIAVVAASCGPALAWGRFALATRGDSSNASSYLLTIPSVISLIFGILLIAIGIYPNLLTIFIPELTKALSGITVPFFQ